jgi:tRNA A37 N6-isopentenylltransferase MiaA
MIGSNNENGYPISMKSGKDKILYDTVIVGLTCDRELLYQRIRIKTELMIEQGLINEARALYSKKNYNLNNLKFVHDANSSVMNEKYVSIINFGE